MKPKGIFTKDTVCNGVFIFTESKNFVSPKFWGLYEESECACCVAIVRNGMVLFVSPDDYKDERVILLDNDKSFSSKTFGSIKEALEDVNGFGNTDRLSKSGSQVATDVLSMDLAGFQWHIPTLKELHLCYDNKVMLCASLAISGLIPLKEDWYWSSTRYGKNSYFVLDWVNGNRCNNYQNDYCRVRPVSSVSLEEL